MSSAQVIRDCQNYFNPSALFAPMIQQEREVRQKEPKKAFKRRSKVSREIRVKMGHGGTLDPLATGVLILGVGKGTKSLQDFLYCTKTYETVVLFGASTDTYDRVGRIIKKGQYDEVTRPVVEKALEAFRGKYKQMPPLYSALKMEGKPLYEYAREGKPIPRDIETRDVEVSELELVEWYEPGSHNHRWPAEEAEQAEKNLVDSVWRVAKRQVASQEEPEKMTPEQEEAETKALAEWQSTKREAEERVDGLVREDGPSPKRRKLEHNTINSSSAGTSGQGSAEPMMSGALGDLPPAGRGSNLIPMTELNTPPPWEGKGPPAAKIRLTVTSGFYVRSFCHDLGEKLGCGAMMAELVRSRQGQFQLGGDNCFDYSDLIKGEEVWGPKVQSMISLWMNQKGTSPSTTGEASVSAFETKPEENDSETGPAVSEAVARCQEEDSETVPATTDAGKEEEDHTAAAQVNKGNPTDAAAVAAA
jgi:tRNA pseudouridine55 synthase